MSKKLFLTTLSLLLLFIAEGCSGGSLKSKIEKGEPLSGEDYAYMVDYMYDAMSEIEMINRSYEASDTEGVMEAGREVAKKYPDFKIYFITCWDAISEQDPEIEKSDLNQDKLARVIDCKFRGWDMFW